MERINAKEAAKILKMNPEMIRAGIRNKQLPIGMLITRKRNNYIIYKELCYDYIEKLKA